jgi:hypothetical protein
MKKLNLTVHGNGINRYTAQLFSETTDLYFSVEVSSADSETAYDGILVNGHKKLVVETCVVMSPDNWTHHQLIKRQYVYASNLWVYLAKLLSNLRVIEKSESLEINFEQDGVNHVFEVN